MRQSIWGFLFLVILSASGCGGGGGGSADAIAGNDAAVFIVHNEDIGRRLHAVDMGSGRMIQLDNLSESSEVLGYMLSPDRNWVAYATDHPGRHQSLFIAATDGSSNREVTGECGRANQRIQWRSLKWSRNSEKLIFDRLASVASTLNVCLVSRSSADSVLLHSDDDLSQGGSDFIDISPQADRLVFAEADQVYIADFERTNDIPLDAYVVGGRYYRHWSPNGEYLAFGRRSLSTNALELWVSRADGSGEHKLHADLGASENAFIPVWSPALPRVAFVSNQIDADAADIFVADPDGGNLVRISSNPAWTGTSNLLSWSPDGNWLLYTDYNPSSDTTDLFATTADGTTTYQVNPGLVMGGKITHAYWSPDGSRVAYNADQEVDNFFQVYVSNRDGSANIRISGALRGAFSRAFAGPYQSVPHWSPDGSQVAFFVPVTSVQTDIYVASADGMRLSKLSTSGGVVRDPGFLWSRDSSRLAWTTGYTIGDDAGIFAAEAVGGQRQRISGDVSVVSVYFPGFAPSL